MNSHRIFVSKPRRRALAPLAGFCALALAGTRLHAQEALRGSIAADSTASSLQAAQTTIGYYNLLLGSTAWRFSSSLAFIYNDNVNDTDTGAEGDLILSPSVNTQVHMPISLRNSLDVGVNVGYSDYIIHSSLNNFYITPGSGLSFDVYADNIKINFHDRVSISQFGYQNPGAGSDQNLVTLQNTAGVGASMDLDKGELGLGYDHNTFAPISSSDGQAASSSDNIYANAGYDFLPQLMAGVEAGASLINGQNGDITATNNSAPANPEALQYSAGVFASAQVSDYISTRVDVGYSIYNDLGGGSNLATSGSGFDFSLSLNHRVNKWLNYTLTAGRSTDLGSYGQAQNRLFFQLSPNWYIINKYTLSTPVSWQKGSAVTTIINANDGDNYTQITAGINVTRTLTQKLSTSASYQYINENGSGGATTYTATIISLSFSYQF